VFQDKALNSLALLPEVGLKMMDKVSYLVQSSASSSLFRHWLRSRGYGSIQVLDFPVVGLVLV
jgi:hypothetical protein